MKKPKQRRWLVMRKGNYALYFGCEPRKTREGYWPFNRYFQPLSARTVKELWGITLKYGGGPVELTCPCGADDVREFTQHWWWLHVNRWVVRWPREHTMHDPPYGLFHKRRRPYLRNGRWIGKEDCEVCPSCLESVLPKKYHLKPGKGPVELKL